MQEEYLKLNQITGFLLLEALMVHLTKDQLQVVQEEDHPGQEVLMEEHPNQPTGFLLLEALEGQLQHLKLNQTTGFLQLEALMAMLRVLMEDCLQLVQMKDLQEHRIQEEEHHKLSQPTRDPTLKQLKGDLMGDLGKLSYLTGVRISIFQSVCQESVGASPQV